MTLSDAVVICVGERKPFIVLQDDRGRVLHQLVALYGRLWCWERGSDRFVPYAPTLEHLASDGWESRAQFTGSMKKR